MSLRALILDVETKAKIDNLVAFAEKNPFTKLDIIKIAKGKAPAPGNRPGFAIEIPIGFRVVFTIEEHKEKKVVRHLSLSVAGGKNMLPNEFAVEALIKLFGYQKPLKECMVYLEDVPPYEAVNVIELI